MMTFIVTALVGVLVGLVSGMLGIGGGMIMVPVFRIVFDMSAFVSTATSLFTIIPTSITGAISHIRAKSCIPKLGIALGIGGACASPIGVQLAQMSPAWLVMLATALVIAYSSITMLRKALKSPKTTEASPVEIPNFTGRQLAGAAAIGFAAGLTSGFVGLGGGFIMVPLLVAFLNIPMKLTSGTSLIAVMILATPASILQCSIGNVDYLAAIAMACGSIPGALVGARLVQRLPERQLRFAFAASLFVAAILLVVKEVGLLG